MHEVMEEAAEEHEHESERWMLPVAVTLAVLAVLVAMATLMGHRAATEELLLQTQASDQWAYFQAKTSGCTNAGDRGCPGLHSIRGQREDGSDARTVLEGCGEV